MKSQLFYTIQDHDDYDESTGIRRYYTLHDLNDKEISRVVGSRELIEKQRNLLNNQVIPVLHELADMTRDRDEWKLATIDGNKSVKSSYKMYKSKHAELMEAKERVKELESQLEEIHDNHVNNNRLKAENTRLWELAQQNFRWSYMLLTIFAKRLLIDSHHKENWPRQHEWHQLVPTSKSIFLHRARDLAGINHAEYLKGIRDGTYDIEDIFDESDKSHDNQ